MDFKDYITDIAQRAKEVSYEIAAKNTKEKDTALKTIAESIHDQSADIRDENKKDIEYAHEKGLTSALIDRLTIDQKRISRMIVAIEDIIALPDPVGSAEQMVTRPNGLRLIRMKVPIGVVAMIYESRPDVTSDAAALTLKSGNSVILRGGKEAIHSNLAIGNAIREGLKTSNFPADAVQMIEYTERDIVDEMLKLTDLIDVVVPRGGESLIRAVTEKSRIPVIKHDKGICHVYVDQYADREKAEAITVNSKVQRPSVCNAAETLLVHSAYPHTSELIRALIDNKVEVRADEAIRKIYPGLKEAVEEDWSTEYLDYIISVKQVDSTASAIKHINQYGSHHSDAIVSENYTSVQTFLSLVDSAAVYANASTRFTDGGEFGLGAELGISTQKLHVRGPMGLEKLTTEKWVIYGNGQIR